MNASIQQMRYLIEVERTRSVSQAAANLYIGQPNLSRMIKELENSLGFLIFERTRKGVRPTEQGVIFLNHARNILREVDFMETLGPGCSQSNRFRICIPRSYVYMELVQNYLSSVDRPINGEIRECHPRLAMEMVENGKVDITVIRYSTQYHDYFLEQTHSLSLAMHPLQRLQFQPIVKATHPLAHKEQLTAEDLKEMTEVAHRDIFYPQTTATGQCKRVYTVDRMAQFQLLLNLSDAYMFSEPLPKAYLQKYGLTQIPYNVADMQYQDALIYKPQCSMSELESGFLRLLRNM